MDSCDRASILRLVKNDKVKDTDKIPIASVAFKDKVDCLLL